MRTHAMMYLLGFGWYCYTIKSSHQKNNFRGVNKRLKPNSPNIETFILSKLLHRLQPNFTHWYIDQKVHYVNGSLCPKQIQDGGRPPSKKNRKNRNISLYVGHEAVEWPMLVTFAYTCIIDFSLCNYYYAFVGSCEQILSFACSTNIPISHCIYCFFILFLHFIHSMYECMSQHRTATLTFILIATTHFY